MGRMKCHCGYTCRGIPLAKKKERKKKDKNVINERIVLRLNFVSASVDYQNAFDINVSIAFFFCIYIQILALDVSLDFWPSDRPSLVSRYRFDRKNGGQIKRGKDTETRRLKTQQKTVSLKKQFREDRQE